MASAPPATTVPGGGTAGSGTVRDRQRWDGPASLPPDGSAPGSRGSTAAEDAPPGSGHVGASRETIWSNATTTVLDNVDVWLVEPAEKRDDGGVGGDDTMVRFGEELKAGVAAPASSRVSAGSGHTMACPVVALVCPSTKRRIIVADGSNPLAERSGVRPTRTSSAVRASSPAG